LALLCVLTGLLWLGRLGLVVRLRSHLVVGHDVSCCWDAFKRQWPEIAGKIDGATVLEFGASTS
jgi:hypothetical protein